MGNLYVYLVINIIIVFAVERTMCIFFGKRRTPLAVFVVSCAFLWFTLIFRRFFDNETLALLLYFTAVMIVSLNYKSDMIRRLSSLVGSFLVLSTGTIIFQFITFLMPDNLLTYNIDIAIDISSISSSIITYIAAYLMVRHFKKNKRLMANLHKLLLPFLFVPVTQILVLIFVHIDPVIAVLIQAVSNQLGVTLLFFYLLYSISKAFEDNLKSALYSQEKEYYFNQCHLMQESVDKMKSYRHDMKLHLTTLKDFSKDNKVAIDYLNSLLGDIEKSDIYSDTGNIAFDSIINFKLKDVLSNNINLQTKIFVPPELNIEVADVVIILGNLLDNAFDAVVKVEDREIRLTVEANKGNLFIKAENTFDGIVKYTDSKGETEKIITTRKKGDNHGYGLKNIRKSVEKYNGYVEITHDDNVFSVVILMYVEGLEIAHA